MTGKRNRRERGQVLPFLVLTMATMGVAAMVAITFGQAVVRRQQAQLVVDAAAFAGAAEQAKGLNTIVRLNEKALHIVQAIQATQAFVELLQGGYEDSDSTTSFRMIPGSFFFEPRDWAEGNWEQYEPDVFRTLDQSIDRVNSAYSVYGKPSRAAARVVSDNFSGTAESFFHPDELDNSGVVVNLPQPSQELSNYTSQLVQLTRPGDYPVGGLRIYRPFSGHWTNSCAPINLFCLGLRAERDAAYAAANAAFAFDAIFLGDHPTYHLGRFYNSRFYNSAGRDVRFTYYMQVRAASPILGRDFLSEIPPIVVMSSGKPYRGFLGAPYHPLFFSPLPNLYVAPYVQEDGREFQFYVAKLIAVSPLDKFQLAQSLGVKDIERFLSAIH